METETVQSDVTTDTESGTEVNSDAETNEVYVNRSAEDYAKRLKEISAESKDLRKRLADEKRVRQSLEEAKLQEEGKHQEIAERYKKERDEFETRFTTSTGKYAYRLVSQQVATEAAKMGCIDTDALMKIVDLDELTVDDDYNVDKSMVKEMLERARKDKSYFFSKPSPSVKDVVPNNRPDVSRGDKSLGKMSMSDKIHLLTTKLRDN